MAKNLFDFGDEKIDNSKQNNSKVKEENSKNNKQDYNKNQTQKEAENLYEKYKNFSQSELIDEFLNTSKQKINEGSLSKDKISQTANLLSPYLNEQQKQFLNSLMDKI